MKRKVILLNKLPRSGELHNCSGSASTMLEGNGNNAHLVVVVAGDQFGLTVIQNDEGSFALSITGEHEGAAFLEAMHELFLKMYPEKA